MSHVDDEPTNSELLAHCRTALERLRVVLRDEPGPAAARRLARVDLALDWLAAGYYGRCGICYQPLDAASLRHDPERMVCGPCSQRPPRRREAVTEAAW